MKISKRTPVIKLDVKISLMDKTVIILHDVIASNTHNKYNMLVFYIGGSEHQKFGIKRFHLREVHSWQVKVQHND